jgi:hypothetical protein
VGISTEQYSSQSRNLEIKRLNAKGWWSTLSRQKKRRKTRLTVYEIAFQKIATLVCLLVMYEQKNWFAYTSTLIYS